MDDLYEDIDYHDWGNRYCDACETHRDHNIVEVAMMDNHGEVYELLDKWLECKVCGKTAYASDGEDGIPF